MVGVAGKRNPGQVCHLAFPTGQIVRAKVGKTCMASGSGKYLRQFHTRTKEVCQPFSPDLKFKLFAQFRFLSGNADGAVV